jgi:hypothetical protein
MAIGLALQKNTAFLLPLPGAQMKKPAFAIDIGPVLIYLVRMIPASKKISLPNCLNNGLRPR